MQFMIADTFQTSLSKLTGEEQKATKTTAFDLQMNPKQQGLNVHRIEQSKDDNFWSVRVSKDIRIIIHRTEGSLLLCYVDHHDAAYKWASRRKIEQHPRTGAAQIVEVRERIEEIAVYKTVETERPHAPKLMLFANSSIDDLLNYGVPEEWINDVQQVTEDGLFDLLEHLPKEAQEALMELAVGNTPTVTIATSGTCDPFTHPDAQRRFRILTNQEELERALDYPWEQWTIFLHPAQQHLVERSYNGPARISGSAGTGKTVVALHRAAYLAQHNPDNCILLLTFSIVLANALHHKLNRLVGGDSNERDRISVYSVREFASDIYEACVGLPPNLATDDEIHAAIHASAALQNTPHYRETFPNVPPFSARFLLNEWTDIVDAWQIDDWDTYRTIPRLGRKTRLGEKQREAVWYLMREIQAQLLNKVTWAALCTRIPVLLNRHPQHDTFTHIIVDESQDLSIPELRMLAALGQNQPDRLFFAGDLGQRIFQQPFSWKTVGVDVRGRSYTLRINYRTSHQIRQHADHLLPKTITDIDGNIESRMGTISVFNGPVPKIRLASDESEEATIVATWLTERLAEGIHPNEIGIFVRTNAERTRALIAVTQAGVSVTTIDEQLHPTDDTVIVSTMHLAKGLEFRAVAVMACDEEIIPLQSRIETVSDESDLTDVYNTERHLLYVACTRARDVLLITGLTPGSEFLTDFRL